MVDKLLAMCWRNLWDALGYALHLCELVDKRHIYEWMKQNGGIRVEDNFHSLIGLYTLDNVEGLNSKLGRIN